jgi:hypothetical protein
LAFLLFCKKVINKYYYAGKLLPLFRREGVKSGGRACQRRDGGANVLYRLIRSDIDLKVHIAKHTDCEVILFELVEPCEWNIGSYITVLIATSFRIPISDYSEIFHLNSGT